MHETLKDISHLFKETSKVVLAKFYKNKNQGEFFMIQYHVFPGGKKRIVTFSYDDGSSNDKRLIELFNKYCVKGTFHLNGMNYYNLSDEKTNELRNLYKGHEVSCHTIRHGWPARMPLQSVITETLEDRKILEKVFGKVVNGMSYPSGSYNDDVIKALECCGIVYSRTTKDNMNFRLPENFLKWHPTCHHRDALSLCERFLKNIDSEWTHPLFYIWGHSNEFRTEEDWAYIEEVLKYISNNDKIWYATNIEIYNYMTAQKQLQISADETCFYNPSAITVWIEKDKKQIIEIPAGETVRI